MKIQSTTSNYYSFKAGMSKKVLSEISHVDCAKVQRNIWAENSIEADFANNKIIAWSVAKVVELLTELQKKYNQPFFAPIQIKTASLEKYGMEKDKNGLYGFTNFLPQKFDKNSDEITPAMSIIFNKDFAWEKLDEISDIDFAKNQTATDHFLESFLHEFFHVFHEGHLLSKYTTEKAISKLKDLSDCNRSQNFQNKYGDLISEVICNYAKESPFDLVACDMSKRFISSLDNQNLLKENPFENSPYSKFYSFIKLFRKQNQLDDLINSVYNGQI